MTRRLHHPFHMHPRKCRIMILAFLWVGGILSGISSVVYCGDSFALLLKAALFHHPAFIGLLSISVIPFILSFFAIIFGLPQLIALICFGKAWLFGLIAAGYMMAFGSAGWLIVSVALLRDVICHILLWLLWITYDTGSRSARVLRVCSIFVTITWITMLDFCFISPFWAKVIDF